MARGHADALLNYAALAVGGQGARRWRQQPIVARSAHWSWPEAGTSCRARYLDNQVCCPRAGETQFPSWLVRMHKVLI